ncbi:hypothetical protein FIBSPDRAFT_889299 [Athelia psychrophila]|uniref:Transcription factor domain-containing protein n=1 Tax=Athelia psychrophila TaxID=1759441 RepID=A0A166M965_9AGAM|nr:hypothetical protein FIBSPDRAFT_889299 [Fibularhizoctonia sp. CBS 109695]
MAIEWDLGENVSQKLAEGSSYSISSITSVSESSTGADISDPFDVVGGGDCKMRCPKYMRRLDLIFCWSFVILYYGMIGDDRANDNLVTLTAAADYIEAQLRLRRSSVTGTLAPTKGNPLLVGQIQRLRNQVKSAEARVEELQNRLRAASGGSHVLLQKDTLAPPVDDLQLYNEDSDLAEAMGSLAVDPDGNAKYHGESAASELIDLIESAVRFSSDAHSKSNFKQNENTGDVPDLGLISRQLGHAIADLFNAFPMGLSVCRYTISEFYPFMPERSRALELVDIYYKKGAFSNPIEWCDMMKTVIEPLYGPSQVASLATIHAHRLAVFFAVLASAAYYERSLYSDTLARQYHVLARAALALTTIVREANTATLQALLIIIWFTQRESVGWPLDKEENQRRRVLFWELYTMEAVSVGASPQRQSLMMGLPINMSARHAGCQFPIDTEQHITSHSVSESGFHDWKRRFTATYVSIAMEFFYSTKTPPYEDLLKLDKQLRHAPIPHHLQCPVEPSDTGSSWSFDPTTAYRQFFAIGFRDNSMSCFAQAVREAPLDPFQHKLAPSVRAAYKSATRLVSLMSGLHQAHPQVTHEQWWLWPSVFSACVILGALVIKTPRCALARDALSRLEEALHLFENGLDRFRAPPMLDTLQRLLKRSHSTMAGVDESHASQQSQLTHDTDSTGMDELAILVDGRKSLIKTKLLAKSLPNSHHSSISPSSSQSMSPLPDGSAAAEYDPAVNFNVASNVSSTDRNYDFPTKTVDDAYQYSYSAVDFGPSHLPPVFEHEREPQYDFLQNNQPPTIPMTHENSQVYIWKSFVEELMAPP